MKKWLLALMMCVVSLTSVAEEKKNSLGLSASFSSGDDFDFYFLQGQYSRFMNDSIELQGLYIMTGTSDFTVHIVGVGGRMWMGQTHRTGSTVPFVEASGTLAFGDIDNDLGFNVGGGVAHFLNENLDARVTAGYQSTVDAVGDGMFTVLAGLNYHF